MAVRERRSTAPPLPPRTRRPARIVRGPIAVLAPLGVVALLLLTTSLIPVGTPPASASGRDLRPDHSTAAPAPSPLAIVRFVAEPASTYLGKYTYLNVTAAGGTPPYNYTYSQLPPGCVSHNITPFLCNPIAAQKYIVKVVVNDSAGASVSATTPLNVTTGEGGTPIIHSFVASPAVAPLYAKLHFEANATSRSSDASSALNYLYENLPPGCASFNSTTLECVPTAAGTYKVALVVTDSFGQFSVAYTWLNVTGGPSPASTTPASLSAMWAIVALIVLIVAVAAILTMRTRRRPPPSDGVRPWKP